jgi:hypothetical protein
MQENDLPHTHTRESTAGIIDVALFPKQIQNPFSIPFPPP